jgi:hypothetical protein
MVNVGNFPAEVQLRIFEYAAAAYRHPRIIEITFKNGEIYSKDPPPPLLQVLQLSRYAILKIYKPWLPQFKGTSVYEPYAELVERYGKGMLSRLDNVCINLEHDILSIKEKQWSPWKFGVLESIFVRHLALDLGGWVDWSKAVDVLYQFKKLDELEIFNDDSTFMVEHKVGAIVDRLRRMELDERIEKEDEWFLEYKTPRYVCHQDEALSSYLPTHKEWTTYKYSRGYKRDQEDSENEVAIDGRTEQARALGQDTRNSCQREISKLRPRPVHRIQQRSLRPALRTSSQEQTSALGLPTARKSGRDTDGNVSNYLPSPPASSPSTFRDSFHGVSFFEPEGENAAESNESESDEEVPAFKNLYAGMNGIPKSRSDEEHLTFDKNVESFEDIVNNICEDEIMAEPSIVPKVQGGTELGVEENKPAFRNPFEGLDEEFLSWVGVTKRKNAFSTPRKPFWYFDGLDQQDDDLFDNVMKSTQNEDGSPFKSPLKVAELTSMLLLNEQRRLPENEVQLAASSEKGDIDENHADLVTNDVYDHEIRALSRSPRVSSRVLVEELEDHIATETRNLEIQAQSPSRSASPSKDTSPEYAIEKLLGSRETMDGVEYLVKWDGYPSQKDWTWEPESSLLDSAPSLVRAFKSAKRQQRRKTKAEAEIYTIERILGRRKFKGVPHYLVKWEGYENVEDRTWEPEDKLKVDVPWLVDAFEEKKRGKK